MNKDLRVSDLATLESDSSDVLDLVVGGVGKTLYERNHDHNPFNDGFRGCDRPFDGPGPFDRPFVDEPGPRR
jgi:hypothetical protein